MKFTIKILSIGCLFYFFALEPCLKKNSSKKSALKSTQAKKLQKKLSKRELREEINKKWWNNLYSDFATFTK